MLDVRAVGRGGLAGVIPRLRGFLPVPWFQCMVLAVSRSLSVDLCCGSPLGSERLDSFDLPARSADAGGEGCGTGSWGAQWPRGVSRGCAGAVWGVCGVVLVLVGALEGDECPDERIVITS